MKGSRGDSLNVGSFVASCCCCGRGSTRVGLWGAVLVVAAIYSAAAPGGGLAAAVSDPPPLPSAPRCSMWLSYLIRHVDIPGRSNCTARGPILSCGGMCHSAALPVQHQGRVVYVPDCQSCQGRVKSSLQIPDQVTCNGVVLAKPELRLLLIPTCSCQHCLRDLPLPWSILAGTAHYLGRRR